LRLIVKSSIILIISLSLSLVEGTANLETTLEQAHSVCLKNSVSLECHVGGNDREDEEDYQHGHAEGVATFQIEIVKFVAICKCFILYK